MLGKINESRPLLGLILAIFHLGTTTQMKIVVIPISGKNSKPLSNNVTEAKGDVSDPVLTMHPISDADAINLYLMVITAGAYTLGRSLIMRQYVDVTGSGANASRLTGAISAGDELVLTLEHIARNSVLSHLGVANSGGINSIDIHSNSRNNTARPDNFTITAFGDRQHNYGVRNYNVSPTMARLTATGSGGTANNYGVFNTSSSPTLSQVTATGSGDTHSYGVLL